MPARSAAPYAEPSSTTVSSSGTPSTDATISSQRRLRAPPPDARPVVGETPSSRRSSSESRSPNATPSSTARTSEPRSWRSERPVKRAARVAGRRVACARPGGTGGRSGPRRPGSQRSASAVSSSNAAPGASASRNQRSAPAAFSITPIASHVSRDGVTEGVDARLRVVRVRREGGEHDTRRPEDDGDRSRLDRRRLRARPLAGRPRLRSRWTRGRAGAIRAVARARRAPRRSSAGSRRRRAACPTRPPRRSPTRR